MLIGTVLEKFAANWVTLKIRKSCSVTQRMSAIRPQKKITDQFLNITRCNDSLGL
ncbi:hypothetical protein SAMN04488109_3568 [Chryseolinea serpens]|uniref:Uncharacterized protein n=1 Tax=Chryseolinea serpens TaxID=947013 RepID=A0A1M5RT35_9BACT|nr:hypothetical protein SAMN04488109_3568 [Chryseolinea serpens]